MKRQEKEEILNKIKELQEQVYNATIENENPFDVKDTEWAFHNGGRYTVDQYYYSKGETDLYDFVPCKDKSIVEARQKRHHLSDSLEKFAYENDAAVTEDMWEDKNILKWFVQVDYIKYGKLYKITCVKYYKTLSTVYFTSHEVAQRAINEVVIPFMENIND